MGKEFVDKTRRICGNRSEDGEKQNMEGGVIDERTGASGQREEENGLQ